MGGKKKGARGGGKKKIPAPKKTSLSVEDQERAATLEEFTDMVRETCVLSSGWMVIDPQFDPSVNKKVAIILEADITLNGNQRVKRCVKIYGDRSFQVQIDSLDMTHKFEQISKLSTTHDADKLFHLIKINKVCLGLKEVPQLNIRFNNLDLVERGNMLYSKACTIIISKASIGTCCNACAKAKQQFMKLTAQTAPKKKLTRLYQLKQGKSSFGEAVYSTLNQFTARGGRGPVPMLPQSSQSSRENMIFDPSLGIHINFDLHHRIIMASMMPPSPPKPKKKSRKKVGAPFSAAASSSLGVYPLQEVVNRDGQLCYVADYNVPSTSANPRVRYGMKVEQPEQYLAVAANGEVYQFGGQQFALEQGQEYEVIEEVTIQPKMETENSNIEIFEVTDEDMENIENIGGSGRRLQIVEVDPNDDSCLAQICNDFQSQVRSLAL